MGTEILSKNELVYVANAAIVKLHRRYQFRL